MAENLKGRKLRAVVELGGLGIEAGADFTVTERLMERADFESLLATGAVERAERVEGRPVKENTPQAEQPGGGGAR